MAERLLPGEQWVEETGEAQRQLPGGAFLEETADAGPLVPTLSAATVFNITATAARPRVTVTF